MVHIEKKVIKGKTYLYLAIRAKINGRSKRVWQKYLGPQDQFQQKMETMKLKLSDSYEISTTEFGFEIALWQIAEQLQLQQIIDEVTGKRAQGLGVSQYLLLAIINRCVSPRSKRKINSWLERSYLKELLPPMDDNYTDRLSLAYTNHFQYLTEENLQQIQLKLNQRLRSIFDVKMDQLFYDPTNFFSYINPTDSDKQQLPRHGNSKEGRRVLNLISLSLVCTNDGIPILHQIYAGNVQDAKHFKSQHQLILQQLQQLTIDPSTVSLIFDKGNISEEAFAGIDEADLQFICSVRPSSHKDLYHLTEKDFEMFTLANGKVIGVKDYQHLFHGKHRRLIVCYNPNKQKWSSETKLNKIMNKIDAVDNWFANRLNSHKWRSAENVEGKIISLVGKRLLPFVNYEVKATEEGYIEYSIEMDNDYFDEEVAKYGKSYLMTSHPKEGMASEDVVWLYRQQFTVERLFSYLKDHQQAVKVRPIFHHRDSSIQGHMFSCLMGLLLLLLLQREISTICTDFEDLEFQEIRDGLEDIKVATIKFAEGNKKSKLISNSSLGTQLMKKLGLNKFHRENV